MTRRTILSDEGCSVLFSFQRGNEILEEELEIERMSIPPTQLIYSKARPLKVKQ